MMPSSRSIARLSALLCVAGLLAVSGCQLSPILSGTGQPAPSAVSKQRTGAEQLNWTSAKVAPPAKDEGTIQVRTILNYTIQLQGENQRAVAGRTIVGSDGTINIDGVGAVEVRG